MKKTCKNHASVKTPQFQNVNDYIHNPDDNLYNNQENDEPDYFYPKNRGKVKHEKILKNDEIIRYDEI